MISEQIVRVANTPCLLLSDRSEVRILLGVPESAEFFRKNQKNSALFYFLCLFKNLVIRDKEAVACASDSGDKFCAFLLTVLAGN